MSRPGVAKAYSDISIPNYTYEEILEALHALGVKECTIEDLKAPTFEKTSELYGLLVEEALGISRAEFSQVRMDGGGLEFFTDATAHTESIAIVSMCQSL